jgi:hypothetical protein
MPCPDTVTDYFVKRPQQHMAVCPLYCSFFPLERRPHLFP